METSCTYTDEWAYFSSDEQRWKNRVMKWADKFPDKVTIIARPEDNDKCIYAKIPACWLEIRPKSQVVLTDEQIADLRERMAKLHQKREAGSVKNETAGA